MNYKLYQNTNHRFFYKHLFKDMWYSVYKHQSSYDQCFTFIYNYTSHFFIFYWYNILFLHYKDSRNCDMKNDMRRIFPAPMGQNKFRLSLNVNHIFYYLCNIIKKRMNYEQKDFKRLSDEVMNKWHNGGCVESINKLVKVKLKNIKL